MQICKDGCGSENPDTATQCQHCGRSLRSALRLHNPGTLVRHYRIKRVIGWGGFGAVYEAEDTRQPGSRVALKESFDPNGMTSFQGEFAALQQHQHPHLPRYEAMFVDQGNGYLVMEFIPGQNLEEVSAAAGGPLEEMQVVGFALQLCAVLAYLHRQNPPILHRDLKPANVRLTPSGLIKLVDFGLFKQGTDKVISTRLGLSPAYAPVEQHPLHPGHTDQRSDIYSLGATLYHLLTGVLPEPSFDRIAATRDPLVPPERLNPRLSPHVAAAITKALHLAATERHQDIASFQQTLVGHVPVVPVPPAPPARARVAVPTLPAWVPEMVLVPAGDFLMGSTDADAKFDEEKPQHRVTLPAYEIGKTEVTNAQFRRFVAGDGYTNRAYWDDAGWQWRTDAKRKQPTYWNDAQGNGDNQPVVGVTLYEAVAYTRWLSVQTGQNFRLPTEAEWEKAARGTDGRIYPWGNTWDEKLANSSESVLGKTTPVGQYPNGASPYGALDMAGNVWEWTWSETQAYPLAQPAGERLYTIKADRAYTLRGGSWAHGRVYARCAVRYDHYAHFVGGYDGFRIVCLFSSQTQSVPSPQAQPALQVQPTPARVAVPTLPAWVPEMVLVPTGDFLMGSTDAAAKFDEEKPQHILTLPAYEIGKTQVTNAQFRRFVAGDGYTNRTYWDDAGWQWRTQNQCVQPAYWNDAQWNGDNQPVVGVTLYEAVAYTRWLRAQTGQNFRLPTEAEWEKAARGSDGRIYPWGNTWDAKRANSSESNLGKTTPVGQYPNGASPYGALDMAGNVWEWTLSEKQAYPLAQPAGESLYTIKVDRIYVLRGGSWFSKRVSARCAYRYVVTSPRAGNNYFGFRLARHL